MERTDFCPYVGLRPFTAAERPYFFGRERDQRVIAANLFASSLTVLYGPSAVGKSSVLQAGVVPQLSLEPHTAIVYFATWQDASYLARLRADCRNAVTTAHGAPLDVDAELPLDEWLARASERFRGTLLIVLDQFEEYLLYHSESGSTSLDEELARIVNRRDVQANVLLGIREDGLAKLDRFRKRIPNLLGNTLRLRRLSPVAAREAITGPVDIYNRNGRGVALPMQIEPALIDAVIEQVSASRVPVSSTGGAGVVKSAEDGELIETAFLQMVMTRLWRDATTVNGTRVMAKASLDGLGGAPNIAKLHLNERMSELPADGQAIAADLFQQLVTPSGAKIAHAPDDLVLFAQQPIERVLPVLAYLTRARLLRRVDPPERYEIFHDALAPAILDWRARYLQEQARKAAVRESTERRNRRLALSLGALVVVAMAVFGAYYWREAEHQRLTNLILAAGGEQMKRLLSAATEATSEAEKRTEEAQLTAKKAQLEADVTIAQAAGQVGRAAVLTAQVKATDAERERARRAAEAFAKQKQADLTAAVDTQKRIDALNSEMTQKGFSNAAIGMPPVEAVGAPPPPTATAAKPEAPTPDPPKAEPPKADPAVDPGRATGAGRGAGGAAVPTPPPATVVRGDYKTIYRQAINARDRKQWKEAAQFFESAASLKVDSGEIVQMPGVDPQPYLPYFNLGLVLQNAKDCPGALRAWERAEQAGAVLKRKGDAEALKRGKTECATAK